MSTFCCIVPALLLLTACAQPSLVTGSAYLFGVNVDTDATDVEPGRLVDPYDLRYKGDPVHVGENVLVSLNRVWLRYLQDVEANVLIYVEVSPDPDPDNKFSKILLQRPSMPQNAFTGQTDAVIWGPARVSANPLRIRLYVVELNRDQDRSLFQAIASSATAAAGALATPAAQSIAANALGNMLLSLKQDSIELAYDVTLVPEPVPTAGAAPEPRLQLVLPLRESQYAVIKGETLYRNVPFPSLLIQYGVPFNWLGMTVSPDSQKREVGNENDDNEPFQYGRYSEEAVWLRPAAWVGETLYSLVRLPFFLAYMVFRRPGTRQTGTAPELLIWRAGELRVAEPATDSKPAPAGRDGTSDSLYAEKSYAVFSVTRANVDLRSALIRSSERHARAVVQLTNAVGASVEETEAAVVSLSLLEIESRRHVDSVAVATLSETLARADDLVGALREFRDRLETAGFERVRIDRIVAEARAAAAR